MIYLVCQYHGSSGGEEDGLQILARMPTLRKYLEILPTGTQILDTPQGKIGINQQNFIDKLFLKMTLQWMDSSVS